jgi:membrane protein YdbS with pleckstrin-like domain
VGSIAVIVAAWNWRRARTSLEIWLPFVVVFMTLVYPIGLRMCEWRYMVHQFPFALTIGVIFSWRLIDRFRAKQVQPA